MVAEGRGFRPEGGRPSDGRGRNREMAAPTKSGFRIERDSMGEMTVPERAYYAAQTARAVDNFDISNLRFGRRMIKAIGFIKAAAARTNARLGLLEQRLADAIDDAAIEVADGRHDGEFVVDVFQTGSGTSTNMNANEVIANRAAEMLGRERGDKSAVHPNDHVNLGQSTNDTFPTAIHVAAMDAVESELIPGLGDLTDAFANKALEFEDVVKAGRTHLQDAVPMTLGQEFSGYASVTRHGIRRLEKVREHLAELPIGGTALGTGLNAHPDYAANVIAELSKMTGLPFVRADNAFEAMQNRDACVELSGALKTIAVGYMKIANDLRLLASGPHTGLAEIELPAVQPGSSIMPGKVNPVIPEAVNMVAAQIIGNDAAICVSGLNGNLDLNVMMPVIAHNLIESVEIAAGAARALNENCVAGIRANRDRCRDYAENSAALVTALAPALGYDRAAAAAKTALAENRPLKKILVEQGLVPEADVDELLDLARLARGRPLEK
jgi:fumarate hydratase class II